AFAVIVFAAFTQRARLASSRESPHANAVTQRLYDEGIAALARSDNVAAERLLGAAAAEDTAFGLAALFHAHAMWMRQMPAAAYAEQDRAVRLAPRQSDHDRLLILSWWAV